MGGSSITPSIFVTVPSAEDKIFPVDEKVLGFVNDDLMADIREKRYQPIISCVKVLSTYMDLLNLRDDLLDIYNEEVKAPKLKIRLLTCGFVEANNVYKEVVRNAKKQLKTSWNKVMNSIKIKLMPRVISLQYDFFICIRSCRTFVLGHLEESLPLEYRDEFIYDRMESGILPLLEYSSIGLDVFKQQLITMKQPSTNQTPRYRRNK